ncbi:MAG: hypothetical protein CL813_02325 [Confluentimicrobium sp.]|jgi:TRAP-type mannitol/chloroaromatic compound transport system permease small subunit|nr:hypothetical protein [Actibacterium sp.]MAQ45196.1 hypothetical protein [Actibacterium sp.]MBF51740.1 hypothetical protein [Actibacterium sp.]MBF51777.1 hypothetical protein [Actibacterium sp.]|tara:strand:- start:662 stop:1243 length:582 start_codon:yes stop_codon:yes gene_type:complete
MRALLALSRGIDAVTRVVGQAAAWLILVAVLVSAGNAVIRKAFNMSSNSWLELQWYLFGAVFMLCAAWALQRNAHVRIDVVTAHLRARTRAWIDLICHVLFLAPFVLLMTWLSWPFFMRSLASGESSSNAGGLILWPAKGLVLLGFIVLIVQTVSEIIKRVAHLTGHLPMPAADEGQTGGHATAADGEIAHNA